MPNRAAILVAGLMTFTACPDYPVIGQSTTGGSGSAGTGGSAFTCGTNVCSPTQSCVEDQVDPPATAWAPYCVNATECQNATGCCFSPSLCKGHCVGGSQPQTILCVSQNSGSTTGGSSGGGSTTAAGSTTGGASGSSTSGGSGGTCVPLGSNCQLGADVFCCSGLYCNPAGLCAVADQVDAGTFTCGTNSCSSTESCIEDQLDPPGTGWAPYCVTTYACANASGCCFSPNLCTGVCTPGSEPQQILCVAPSSGGTSSGGSSGGGSSGVDAGPGVFCGPGIGQATCAQAQYCTLQCFGPTFACADFPAQCLVSTCAACSPSCACLVAFGVLSSPQESCTEYDGGVFVDLGGGC